MTQYATQASCPDWYFYSCSAVVANDAAASAAASHCSSRVAIVSCDRWCDTSHPLYDAGTQPPALPAGIAVGLDKQAYTCPLCQNTAACFINSGASGVGCPVLSESKCPGSCALWHRVDSAVALTV